LELKPPKVIFACYVANKPKYIAQAVYLLESIRSIPEFKHTLVKIFGNSETLKKVLSYFKTDKYITPTPKNEFYPDIPVCNKLQALDYPLEEDFDYYILLDTDTLVVRNFLQELKPNCINIKLADFATFPHRQFSQLGNALAIEIPKPTVRTTVSFKKTIPYFNTGVVVIPKNLFSITVHDWTNMVLKLTQNASLVSGFTHFTEQAALAFSLLKNPKPIAYLSNSMNFPAHCSFYYLHLYFVNPFIIHYHRQDKNFAISFTKYPICNQYISKFRRMLNLKQNNPFGL